MRRYYFHVQDGELLLDGEGIEFTHLNDVRTEALQASAELLKCLQSENFWAGEPWKFWVTDQPNGGGNTLLTLTFSAQLP